MALTTHKVPHNGDGYSEALDYNRLPEPWREWAGIAWTFAHFAGLGNHQDEQDLMQDIITRLIEVAEVYRQRGMPFHAGATILTAKYTRLRFYRQKKRWKRVYSVSLNSIVSDNEGDETEMIETILDEKGINQDTWLDFKHYYRSRPKMERKAMRKLLRDRDRDNGNGNGHRLPGHDWRLIKRFREAYQTA